MEGEAIRGDVFPKEQLRRIDRHESDRGGVEFRVKAQVPLDYYHRRSQISAAEYRAGNRLFNDFYLSGQSPGNIINLDSSGRGQNEFTEKQIEALLRWRDAINTVKGTVGRLMVLNICCYGRWLKDNVDSEENRKGQVVEYFHYRTPQEAMPRLREALGDLIDFYENA